MRENNVSENEIPEVTEENLDLWSKPLRYPSEARPALSALIAEVRRLRAEVEELSKIEQPTTPAKTRKPRTTTPKES